MLRNDSDGDNNSFFGDGDYYSNGKGGGYGYGYGDCDGDFDGDCDYRDLLNRYGDSHYITSLIINDDPITTAYQARTMQTLGDHYAEK